MQGHAPPSYPLGSRGDPPDPVLQTFGLYNLDTYLSMIGGYGATAVIYLQALSQLDDLYGPHRARTLLGNCHQQVFYPPRDPLTARYMTELFGTELAFTASESQNYRLGSAEPRTRSTTIQEGIRPALAAPAALPEVAVLLVLGQYRVLAERMNPLAQLDRLPPPPPMVRRARARPAVNGTPMASHVPAEDSTAPAVGQPIPVRAQHPAAPSVDAQVPRLAHDAAASQTAPEGAADKRYF